jgi:rod shape-determining protein MreC
MHRLTRRQRLATIVLAIVAAAFVTLDLTAGGLQSAHDGVRGMVGALYRGTDSVLGPVRRFLAGVPHAAADQSRIEALERRNRALRARLSTEATDRSALRQLRRLQLTADAESTPVLPARVLALAPAQGFDWTITVDAGAADGARVGQTVSDGFGLVGRVIAVDSATSVVLLAVDPGSGVGVRDLRNGELGVVTGAGTSGFTLRPLQPNVSIKVGDRLQTGPAGRSSYLAGLSVGTVRSVAVHPDGTVSAAVTPTSSPTALALVGLLLDGRGSSNAVAAGSRPALRPAGARAGAAR